MQIIRSGNVIEGYRDNYQKFMKNKYVHIYIYIFISMFIFFIRYLSPI